MVLVFRKSYKKLLEYRTFLLGLKIPARKCSYLPNMDGKK